jgi:chitinase
VKALSNVVDEFNVMAYDLHGKWDRDDPIGPYVYAHTNLTEIDDALDLFWRNDIDASKINLGLAVSDIHAIFLITVFIECNLS